MKVVIQRVTKARVEVEGKTVGQIGQGIVLLLGIMKGDTMTDVEYLAGKIVEFRIFQDQEKKMNRSLLDIGGEALVVSQFTLAADGKKGRRPSFDLASPPEEAVPLYEAFVESLRQKGVRTQTGIFGAMMAVELVNDGPVTFVLEKASNA